MRRYEQAAAAYNNYINLLPNKDRSDKAAWSRSQVRFLQVVRRERSRSPSTRTSRGRPAHGGLPRHRRQGHRQGERQRRPLAGLRPRHRLRADDDLAADGVVGERASDHLHARAPASAKSACAACSSDASTRSRSARSSCSNVPTLIKAPALRGIPKRETESFSPLALGLSMTIDYAHAEADDRRNAAGRDRRLHAADAPSSPLDGARPHQRHAPDLLRRRHRRRGDLDQHGDGRGARSRSRAQDRAARSTARQAGIATRSCCRA